MSFFNPSSSGAMVAGDVLNTIAEYKQKIETAAKHAKTSSLVEVTAVGRVEPLAIIDTDSINTEYIGQVMQCAHNIFAAYYVQAISLFGDVGKINVIKTLDKLNPNRKPDRSGFISHVLSDVATESFNNNNSINNYDFGLSMESFKLPTYGLEAKNENTEDKIPPTPTTENKSSIKVSDKASSTILDLSNITVGKLIDVTLTDNGNTLTIPIAIRLIANEMPLAPMLRLLSLQGLDRTWTERYWKWRAGRIGFIKDLILMQDLIREDKKAMMQDKQGILDEIVRRARNNKLAGFFSKNASMNESANVIVFSEETARLLKQQHNIDIENFKQRQSVFDSSYAMLLICINREYDRITFYTNGMPLGSSMGKNELRAISNKNSGTDLVEIFTALKKSDSASLF